VRWALQAADEALSNELAARAGLSPLMARLLVLRGVSTAEEAARFLAPSLTHLHSPYLMLGMQAAVPRVCAAIERKEQILIYGDYDVDGTTAIVILKTAIELCGGTADFHVPHRIRDGYGMKDDVVEQAAAGGVRLIISVDTGIRAFAAAETARRLGMDLIVTDHHLAHAADGVPAALAVLNPNQPGCEYPCKALCGAGVAFKLAQAMLEKQGLSRLLPSFLKMVAIATIADAVPLTGENRVFAKLGLEGLRSPVNAGLKALFAAAELNGSRPLSTSDVAFRLAPRLNAAGRMDVARDVIELFTVKDAERARELAERLNQLNAERQQEEARICKQIETLLDGNAEMREAFCIVVESAGWHRGVIGIAATRVVERYCRPALVIAVEQEEGHGSGRSIQAFHLLNALESCAALFTRFGGHAHAVGFALPASRIAELRTVLDKYARARLTVADFEPVQKVDAEVQLGELSPEFFAAIQRMEPFGMGNPQPVFQAQARLLSAPRAMKEKHIKMRLTQSLAANSAQAAPTTKNWEAMGWRMAERLQQENLLPGDILDIAFSMEMNSHPDFGGLQLALCDCKRAEARGAWGT